MTRGGEVIDGHFDEAEGTCAFTLGAAFCLAGGADLGGGFFLEEAALAAMGQLLLFVLVLVRKVQGSNLLCLKRVSLVYVYLVPRGDFRVLLISPDIWTALHPPPPKKHGALHTANLVLE